MITVTRLNGGTFALNPDLIERVETTPDTVITLVDGTKYVVRETLEELVYRVREAKASVIALSHALDHAETNPAGRQLRVVPGPDANS
jgi:flagellar protein FlbD